MTMLSKFPPQVVENSTAIQQALFSERWRLNEYVFELPTLGRRTFDGLGCWSFSSLVVRRREDVE